MIYLLKDKSLTDLFLAKIDKYIQEYIILYLVLEKKWKEELLL